MSTDTETEELIPGTHFSEDRRLLSRSQRRAALVVVVLLGIAGLWTLRDFLPALGWAAIFAVSLWPWYSRLCDLWPRHRRILIPGVTTFVVLLAFVVPLVLVISALAHDSVAVAQWVRQAGTQGIEPPEMLAHLPYGENLVVWWKTQLGPNGALSRFSPAHLDTTWLRIDAGGRFVGAILHRLLLIVFMLLTLFFALRDGDAMALGARIAAKRAFGELGERLGDQIIRAIRGTVNGLVVVGFAEGLLLGVAYALTGVLHPALFGLLTALLSAIPLGAVVAYVAAAASLAANGQIAAAVGIVVLGSVVVFIADHFIRPVLIGGSTRLPFLWVLLGILGGIEAWGLIGVILGPALMAALLLLWREWVGSLAGPLNPRRPVAEAEEPLI